MHSRPILVEHALVVPDCGPVALAGCRLETLAVDDYDPAANIADQVPPLQCASGDSDRTPAHSEHVAEILMRELKVIRVRTVMGHQEPARQPRFGLVKSRAGC